MTRLTKYDRERMARALVEHKFRDEATELTAESAALFDAVLDERYDAATKRAICQLTKLHPDSLTLATDLNLNVRGMRFSVGAAMIGVHNIARWSPQVAARYVLKCGGAALSEALTDRLAKFALDLQTFNAKLKPAYTRALGTLNQFGASKKLLAEWPEAAPVIGHLIPTEDRALPVVQLEAINDEFGLPPAEAAEAA